MLSRALLILVLIAATLTLSIADQPRVDRTGQIARQLRSAISLAGPALPEDTAGLLRSVRGIDGVRHARVLSEGEAFATLCQHGLRPSTAYLAVPSVDSAEGGIYGALYALDKRHAVAVVVLSPVASTEAQARQLRTSIDGTTLTCA